MRLLFTSLLSLFLSFSFFGQSPCNNQTSVTYQGYEYDIVEIGDQCWFAENCRYLPTVSPPSASSVTDPHYYVYGYEGTDAGEAQATSNYPTYGVLYNWPAVMTEGICPSGWHIPSDEEWQTMEISLGMSESEAAQTGWRGSPVGDYMKSTSGWWGNGSGSNSSGFTCLPGGSKLPGTGGFNGMVDGGHWWSASESDSDSWGRELNWGNEYVYRANKTREQGYSARCVTNELIVTIPGCTDPTASNYNPEATEDDGSCEYPPGPCNNQLSVTYQGYEYDIVEIGYQCWFAENCRYFPSVSPSSEGSETEPHYYVYDYEGTDISAAMDTENYATYGVLYNWPAVMTEGICPSGWHIPSDEEFTQLTDFLGGEDVAGGKMKEAGYDHWNSPNTGATNSSGWTGLPGGLRNSGGFGSYGNYGDWWSASEFGSGSWKRILYYNNDAVGINTYNQEGGFSARCVTSQLIVQTPGCTDPTASNYNPEATEDDGSCEYPPGPCNNQTSVTYEGYEYDIVEIGLQCWFAENCRYLPSVSPSSEGSEIDPLYYIYGYEGTEVGEAQATSNYATYGVLYNWPAVMTEGICPSGWHIPSDGEWQTMEISLGMNEADAASSGWRGTDEGYQMKSTSGWNSGGNGSNSSGFNALPSGYNNYGFGTIGEYCTWWSSGLNSSSWAGIRSLYYSYGEILRDFYPLHPGYSARCITNQLIVSNPGCTIEQACNFNPEATDDDGSCLFVGESCDDGDETTANDTVQDDCSCSGEAVSGCTYSVACNYNPEATVFDDSCYFVGDPCDDGNADTVNDTYDSNCECVGESGIPGCTDMQACNYNEEANFNDGSCLYSGDACDDGNVFTENDAYTTDCECIGDEIEIISGCTYEAACNYNPEANQNDMSCLFPGDECDDNDASTGNDIYNDECECEGESLQGGCTYEAACNYDPEAEFDNNTCIFVGDPCDDGDPNTLDDEIQEDCECTGTPISTVDELEALSVLIYPNPASNNLTVDLGDLNGVNTTIKLYDSSSKLVFEKQSSSTLTIDVSGFAKGMYSLELSTDEQVLRSQVIID